MEAFSKNKKSLMKNHKAKIFELNYFTTTIFSA
jgi:hypothetical protein